MGFDLGKLFLKIKETALHASAYAKRRVALRKIKRSLKERLAGLKNRLSLKKNKPENQTVV